MTESSTAKRRAAVALLLAMVLLGVFPLDVVLPSFPALSNHFNRSTSDIAFSVSLFAVGISLSQLLIGPLSDNLGRKGLLLAGMLISILGGIGCVLVSDFTWFLFFRCIQAIGCGSFVLAQALVQDLFAGKARDQLRIVMITASGVFISVSPLAGTLLQQAFDWPGSFWVFVALATMVFIKALFFLENSLPLPHPSRTLVQSYRLVCRDSIFIGYWLISGLAFACHFSFIVMSPLLFLQHLQLSPYAFSLVLLLYGLAYLCAGVVAQMLSRRIQARAQINVGTLMIVFAGVLMLLFSSLLGLSILSVLLPMIVCTAGTTVARPIATSRAMDVFPEYAGTAASIGGMLVFVCGGGISALVNLSRFDLQTTLAVCFMVLGTAMLGLHALINRQQTRRRVE